MYGMIDDIQDLMKRVKELEAKNAQLTLELAASRERIQALVQAEADTSLQALAESYRGQRVEALEAENAALREDKARLVEALGSIRNWRPPDGTLLEVKDLQWFKDIAAARKEAAMTLAEINESIAHAEDLKDRVRKCADEEEVQEYRQDMYSRIDRINNRLAELYQERQRLEDAARKGGT